MSKMWPLSSKSSWSSWGDSQPKPKVRVQGEHEGRRVEGQLTESHRNFTKVMVLKDEAQAVMDQKDQHIWAF